MLSGYSVPQRFDQIAPSDLMVMMRLGQQMLADGEDVLFFAQGEPDFDTPQHIKEAGAHALLNEPIRYAPPEGLLALRELVAEKLRRDNGVSATPSEVIVTPGATMGVFLALTSLLDPGDEVLVLEPGFGPYMNIIQMAGGVPIPVPMRITGGRFRPDEDSVESNIGPRSRAIILNSPANPTGVVLSRDELVWLGQVAERHDLIILSDEVYEYLVFDQRTHLSIAALSPELRARTIVVNSLSKTYAMTGWRAGYSVAPPAIAKTMRQAMELSGRCVPEFIQQAAIAALGGSQACVEEMRSEYARRRDLMVGGLNEIKGIRCQPPEGAFYVFAEVVGLDADSRRLARNLLKEAGIVAVPGRHYGPSGEGHLRFSFATSDEKIRQGLARIDEASSRVADVHVGV